MDKDVRGTERWTEIEELCRTLRRPGSGRIADALEIDVAPDGTTAVFSALLMDRLEGAPQSRIARADLETGDVRILTLGPNSDRLARFSPDGGVVAFLSDRAAAGDFQLHLLDPRTGAVTATPPVDGWVEYLHWAPGGGRVLLAVAGHGADIAGGQGAVTSTRRDDEQPSWFPEIEAGDEDFAWRHAWVYDVETGEVARVSPEGVNVWEVAWAGDDALVAVVSPRPGEGDWYRARLELLEISGGRRELYAPTDQLGLPAASPSGTRIAVVEAFCSDRWFVAGDLHVIDRATGAIQSVDTHGVDVTFTQWRSEDRLLLGGHRGFETVVGVYDAGSGTFVETWVGREVTTGGRFLAAAGIGEAGDVALVGEGYTRAPELAVIRDGAYRSVVSFDTGYAELAGVISAVEEVTWAAPDGLRIEGWLLRPRGEGPHPLVMNVHGGPVGHLRPTWLGRNVLQLALVRRGYAVFFPNPRGSAGRGQDFARQVRADFGGADARDLLAGLDALVERGIADPARIGVMGGSYGGFMTSWLVTQDQRFAAAVPCYPHTNQVTEHLLSNIGDFMTIFMDDSFDNPGGRYFDRSPVMHARKVTTPTLSIAGALDACTPPEEARQFHRALRHHGVAESALLVYPEEGHGVKKYPTLIDYVTRVVLWFEHHMPA